jgi:hypothetical protein
MNEPPLPCEMTTSGSLSPSIEQSFTPGSAIPSTSTSCGGIAQGDHTAPVNAGPAASAGTLMSRSPAASAAAAETQKKAASKRMRERIANDRSRAVGPLISWLTATEPVYVPTARAKTR